MENDNAQDIEFTQWCEKNRASIENYKKIREKMSSLNLLKDISKNESRSFRVLNKTNVIRFLKNPLINKDALRETSQFLYRIRYEYRRIIWYLAGMFVPECHSVIPNEDINGDADPDKILKSYNDTLKELQKFDMKGSFFKVLTIAWREDVCYCLWLTDGSNVLIEPFDGKYGKIVGVNYDNTLVWAMDMTYFNTRKEILPTYGKAIEAMYRLYEEDSSLRWQIVPIEVGFAIKINMEDPLLPYPPLASLFLSLIDLADLQEIQAVKDQASIYKLLIAKLDTVNGSEEVDNFTIDLDTALTFFDRMVDSLPSWVTMALSPMDVKAVDVYRDETDDVNRIADATENLFSNCGGQVLYTSSISTSSGLEAALIADTNYALSSVVPQIEKIMNRWMIMQLGKNACRLRFYEVSPYTLKNFKKTIKEDATLGLPNKLLLSNLNGMDEKDTLALNNLEIDILELDQKFKPMQTTYTQSSDNDNEKDADELTDEGLDSRDADKNDK